MAVRMFEYGFNKAKETASLNSKNSIKNRHFRKTDNIKTIYFPKQKVIFFEENKNIEDSLYLNIVFPDGQVVFYSVGVMKYWELTDEDLLNKKMYPLIPLQLFNLRKELHKAQSKNDIQKIKEMSYIARDLAQKLANESKDLFDNNEILGDDFHTMLLAINNLIEYLNRNYLNDDRLKKEVNIMIKTLYDPEVEKRGREQGIAEGIELGKAEGKITTIIKNAKSLLDVLDDKTIAEKLEIDEEIVRKLREEASNK